MIKNLVNFCFYGFVCYAVYIAYTRDPSVHSTVNQLAGIVEDDVESIVGNTEEILGIEIETKKERKEALERAKTNGRTIYPDYSWKKDGVWGLHNENSDYNREVSQITMSIAVGCITESDRHFYYDKINRIEYIFHNEKLPRDEYVATDKQIQQAIDWRNSQTDILINPLMQCIDSY